MININKIGIYNKYQGDIDAWARLGNSDEKLEINDSDWSEIDDLLQDIQLSKSGNISIDYQKKILDKISKLRRDEESLRYFTQLRTAD